MLDSGWSNTEVKCFKKMMAVHSKKVIKFFKLNDGLILKHLNSFQTKYLI